MRPIMIQFTLQFLTGFNFLALPLFNIVAVTTNVVAVRDATSSEALRREVERSKMENSNWIETEMQQGSDSEENTMVS